MGAETMTPMVRRLLPDAEITSAPRLSTLRYGGRAPLHRVPRRSAVVAFSAGDVYALAERLKERFGGVAVVLGALSPRTRNAQVAMYQAGEVRCIVATDAIGMGLNLDLDHVVFAGLHKFDGIEQRRLRTAELAQIAGRAGRFDRDGMFWTMSRSAEHDGCPPLHDDEIDTIERHDFPPARKLFYRNPTPSCASLQRLRDSLRAPPPRRRNTSRDADRGPFLPVKNAPDEAVLAQLVESAEVRRVARGTDAVGLLWEVCQVPDFRQRTTGAHAQLLGEVYLALMDHGALDVDEVGRRIARLDRTEGGIQALVDRLAAIRTWTFMAHKPGWLPDAEHWQGRAREVEDRLSDALNARLTRKFTDRKVVADFEDAVGHREQPGRRGRARRRAARPRSQRHRGRRRRGLVAGRAAAWATSPVSASDRSPGVPRWSARRPSAPSAVPWARRWRRASRRCWPMTIGLPAARWTSTARRASPSTASPWAGCAPAPRPRACEPTRTGMACCTATPAPAWTPDSRSGGWTACASCSPPLRRRVRDQLGAEGRGVGLRRRAGPGHRRALGGGRRPEPAAGAGSTPPGPPGRAPGTAHRLREADAVAGTGEAAGGLVGRRRRGVRGAVRRAPHQRGRRRGAAQPAPAGRSARSRRTRPGLPAARNPTGACRRGGGAVERGATPGSFGAHVAGRGAGRARRLHPYGSARRAAGAGLRAVPAVPRERRCARASKQGQAAGRHPAWRGRGNRREGPLTRATNAPRPASPRCGPRPTGRPRTVSRPPRCEARVTCRARAAR